MYGYQNHAFSWLSQPQQWHCVSHKINEILFAMVASPSPPPHYCQVFNQTSSVLTFGLEEETFNGGTSAFYND